MERARRLARQQTNLDCPYHLLRVARRDAQRRTWVQPFQYPVHVLSSVSRNSLPQSFVEFLGTRRRLCQAFQKRSQVKSRPRRQDRQFPPGANRLQNFRSTTPVLARRENLL